MSAVIIEVRCSVELCPVHADKDWVYLWNVMIYAIMETVGLCTVSLPVLRYVLCVVGVWGKATN